MLLQDQDTNALENMPCNNVHKVLALLYPQHYIRQIPQVVYVLFVQGCVALITPDTLDVLCHAAVRARNCSVLLASCSEPQALDGLRSLAGRHITLTIAQVRSHATWHDMHPNAHGGA